MEFWTGGGLSSRSRVMPGSLLGGYDAYVRDAVEAEALGFDAYGAAEHHFMYDSFMPIPLQALAAAAAATSRIKLQTGAMLQPLYDPIEAAEYAATLDVISNGRASLGLGMGYRPLEFDGLATSKKTRGARLIEAIHVISLATSRDEFSYEGRHYRYDRARLSPTPVQRPIPIWFCGGTSIAGATRAGKAGIPYWIANSTYERTKLMTGEYRRIGRKAGWPESQLKVAAFKDVCIGATIPEAEAQRQYLLDAFYDEHILGYGYLVDDQGNHLYNLSKDHPIYRRFVDSIFCGTLDMVIEELKRYEDLGIDAVYMGGDRRFLAEKILPEFRRN